MTAARKSNVTMLEEILWHRRYLRACFAMDVRNDIIDWPSVQWSWDQRYIWNSRHIAASLLLDGAPIEALP